jgi:hypothetical protein
MTPVRFNEGSSTESEESDTDPSVMDLLSCFKEVSCNGLKVGFDKHKVDFLPSLSAISLVKKREPNIDEFSSGSQLLTTPLKKPNMSIDSTTGTGLKQYSESNHKEFEDFEHSLIWSNKEPLPYNRKPIYQELKDLSIKCKMSEVDLEKSWFTVLFSF